MSNKFLYHNYAQMAVNNIENNTNPFNTEFWKEVAAKATFGETLGLLFPDEEIKNPEDKPEEVGWDRKKEKAKLKKESEEIKWAEQEELDAIDKEKEKVIRSVVEKIRAGLHALEGDINNKK